MGMAAGQARLLSITSRMSDNELRAQLINNDKMRLATKSAQVSEAYTTALNDAQLMFTSYDKSNNTSYKELTFNALTAYNQYNNQYAISNSAGQLLVSETDAKNFQNSGDVNEFLEKYGLKQTTTYFDSLDKYQGANVTYYDSEGNKIEGSKGVIYNTGELVDVDGVTKNVQVDSGKTPAELQNMYDGQNGYDSYMNIKSSEYYYNYSSALTNFTTAKESYESRASEIKNNLLKTSTYDGNSLSDIKKSLATATDYNSVIGYIDQITAIINGGDAKVKNPLVDLSKKGDNDKDGTVKDYYASMTQMLTDAKNDTRTYNSGLSTTEDGNTITLDGSFVLKKSGGAWKAYLYKDGTDNEDPVLDESIAYDVIVGTDGKLSFNNGKTDDTKIEYSGIPVPEQKDGKYVIPEPYEFKEVSKLDVADLQKIADTVIDSLINSVETTFDVNKDEYKYQWTLKNNSADYTKDANGNKVETPEYAAYKAAAATLYETIFGKTMPPASEFDENNWAKLADINEIRNLGISFLKDDKKGIDKENEFKKIEQVTILDNIMDTYGEPSYTWIDTTNHNENGTAKAQWYTNLYNKMDTSGYKALQDGLASSSEWIKFAFESGLVCLEQVDSENKWNTTTYTNCSDITEQSNNTAITKAEAEYNAAMAKIENKDKRYDLELKNIDTEHNSLQTEYDSIKTAIDKNIERTFKIYS